MEGKQRVDRTASQNLHDYDSWEFEACVLAKGGYRYLIFLHLKFWMELTLNTS
jgi:hypothetical protein